MLEYVAILALATAIIELVGTCLRVYLELRRPTKDHNEQSCEQKQ